MPEHSGNRRPSSEEDRTDPSEDFRGRFSPPRQDIQRYGVGLLRRFETSPAPHPATGTGSRGQGHVMFSHLFSAELWRRVARGGNTCRIIVPSSNVLAGPQV